MGIEGVVDIIDVDGGICGERDGLGVRLGGFWELIHAWDCTDASDGRVGVV